MKLAFPKKIVLGAVMASALALTGCLTDDDKDEETTPIAWTGDTALTVGAQGHLTLGTAIDLDGKKVLLSDSVNNAANAYANLRSVDILFAYTGSSIKLLNPVAAKAAGDIALALNYRDSVITASPAKFVKVATEPANWDAGVAAYTAGTELTSSVAAAGDMFVVKTNLGNYVLVTVGAITNGTGNTASTTLTVNLKAM